MLPGSMADSLSGQEMRSRMLSQLGFVGYGTHDWPGWRTRLYPCGVRLHSTYWSSPVGALDLKCDAKGCECLGTYSAQTGVPLSHARDSCGMTERPRLPLHNSPTLRLRSKPKHIHPNTEQNQTWLEQSLPVIQLAGRKILLRSPSLQHYSVTSIQ